MTKKKKLKSSQKMLLSKKKNKKRKTVSVIMFTRSLGFVEFEISDMQAFMFAWTEKKVLFFFYFKELTKEQDDSTRKIIGFLFLPEESLKQKVAYKYANSQCFVHLIFFYYYFFCLFVRDNQP